jgi:hypothetical protein
MGRVVGTDPSGSLTTGLRIVTNLAGDVSTGSWVPELNGFVRIVGGPGSAKVAFAGLNQELTRLTTFGIRTVQ